MREIGGYFELEQLKNNEYHQGLLRLNTARNALLYVLKGRAIRKLFIPYYLCDCVSEMLQKEGYEFEYYSINEAFHPQFNKQLAADEWIYIVNFYGQLSNEQLHVMKQKFGRILVDHTQAFFQKPLTGIDTIYSCRKFFGVPDGAYLSSDQMLNEWVGIDQSIHRMQHLLGRLEGNASAYYTDFKRADEMLKDVPIRYMSKITQNLLGAIDYERTLRVRNENYVFLHDALHGKNKLKLSIPDGAFCYPFYVDQAEAIRSKLLKRNIYIPQLWPNVLNQTEQGSLEQRYVRNILPLPCDQRYNKEDMDYLIKCINEEATYEQEFISASI